MKLSAVMCRSFSSGQGVSSCLLACADIVMGFRG